MSNAKRLSELAPGARVPIGWDFTSDFEAAGLSDYDIAGDPRVTVSVDSSMRRTSDASPDDMLISAPQVSGKRVIQLVEGRTDGVDYKVKCEVDVSSTPLSTLVKTSIVPVRTQ